MAKNKTDMVRAVCRNCGTHTVGRWCHVCGQDLFAGRNHKLRELAGDMLGTLFALDGKALRTLRYLVAFPGRLTREFYAGRIVRYVYPSKLFWFIAIVFFALLWNVAEFGDDADRSDGIRVELSGESPSAAQKSAVSGTDVPEPAVPAPVEADAGNAAAENAAAPAAEEGARKRGLLENKDFQGYFMSALPYVILMLVPVFALLVWGGVGGANGRMPTTSYSRSTSSLSST